MYFRVRCHVIESWCWANQHLSITNIFEAYFTFYTKLKIINLVTCGTRTRNRPILGINYLKKWEKIIIKLATQVKTLLDCSPFLFGLFSLRYLFVLWSLKVDYQTFIQIQKYKSKKIMRLSFVAFFTWRFTLLRLHWHLTY